MRAFPFIAFLVAQTAPAVHFTDQIPQLLGTIASVGFAVWYGFHVTSHTIPKIIADHRAAMQVSEDRHREERREERQDFREALDQVVLHCREENAVIREFLATFSPNKKA